MEGSIKLSCTLNSIIVNVIKWFLALYPLVQNYLNLTTWWIENRKITVLPIEP